LARLVAGFAFLSSVAAFLVIAGGGLVLLLLENSGERGAGALLALSGAISFAAAMILLFAREGAFAGRGGTAGALTAALLGALPLAALSIGALRFSGLPFGSSMPLVDWSAFAAGLAYALGALSVLAVGYRRLSDARFARPQAVRPMHHPSAATHAAARPAEQPRSAPRPERAPEPERHAQGPMPAVEGDEVRVTPIELPSIGQFRQR
jgi:hypothetical protein